MTSTPSTCKLETRAVSGERTRQEIQRVCSESTHGQGARRTGFVTVGFSLVVPFGRRPGRNRCRPPSRGHEALPRRTQELLFAESIEEVRIGARQSSVACDAQFARSLNLL